MFCQYCGTPIHDAAQFCTACGKPTSGRPAEAESATEKLASQLKIMGILWIVYSIFRIAMGAWTLTFSHYLLPMVSNSLSHQVELSGLLDMLHGLYAMMFAYSLAAGVLGMVAGWGLLRRRPWGRILGLIAAFASILSMPFGTALTVYTLMILLASGAENAYRRLAAPG